jgi:hypothetical protein
MNNTMTDWKFNEAKNTAVIADKYFMEQKEPCLHVSHDADDGGWQFLTENTNSDSSRAIVVALSSAVSLDPTLNELYDLPIGWVATRSTNKSAWQRQRR